MSKRQLIDAIRHYNPTAGEQFLIEFNETALKSYLRHLRFLRRPRGGRNLWVRGAETPAVVTRQK
ncbi:MAG: hypothetical protein GC162_03665 [Planctomycetes bacterium]|nr:hypothetical protein [Planctomycetota bacterium]